MTQQTAIEWTDLSWNPIHGCSKVSPGCAHCYAETLSRRYRHTTKPWTPANAADNVILKPHKLREPLSNSKDWRGLGVAAAAAGKTDGKLVFVNSTSDLFHERVPDEFIAQVFAVMASASRHTFQILTKRPERMPALLGDDRFVLDVAHRVTADTLLPIEWPLPNVWLGTSIENRRFVARADMLRATPAAVRFISAEPLLGPLTPLMHSIPPPYIWWAPRPEYTVARDDPGLDLTSIDWVICGGESGPRHRPIERSWVVSLLDACLARRWEMDGDQIVRLRDEPPFFLFKQWGGRTPKAGGRELDGREWSEFPQARELVA